jgi:hypothetical protein
MFAIMKTFVTDISASTGKNDFIFDMWLWHGDLYGVSPFQVYRTSTSCLPRDLEFFMFAVMKTFVTDISASTGRKDFIFDMWLWHGDLYCVSPFQVYCTSTSCLPCDLRIFHVLMAFSGNECWDIYKFDTNERVGVFLAWRSVQHLVVLDFFHGWKILKVDGRDPQNREKNAPVGRFTCMLKFRFIWSSGFRGEEFEEINQSETRIACGSHVC